MGPFTLLLAGAGRDPWWDPDGRRRRRRMRRRLEVLLAALLVAAADLGLRAGTTHAATTVNLDQWASLDLAWQNGNLNGNNARYPEGGLLAAPYAVERRRARTLRARTG